MAGRWALRMKIVGGRNLVARDISGKSDPYLRVSQDNVPLHTTATVKRSLSPDWNEQFSAVIDNLNHPLFIQVYDYDVSSGDDYLGEAVLPLPLPGEVSEEVCLTLKSGECSVLQRKEQDGGLGTVTLRVGLTELGEEDSAVGNFISTVQGSPKKDPRRVSFPSFPQRGAERTGVVHVVVVQASGLMPPSGATSVTSKCRLALGKSRVASKTIRSFHPKWRQGFNLSWFQGVDDFLEVTIVDKGNKDEKQQIGRTSIDLTQLDKEKTHNLWLKLKDHVSDDSPPSPSLISSPLRQGSIHLLVTLSGSQESLEKPEKKELLSGVGLLRVTLERAEGLSKEWMDTAISSLERCGRDPYAVIEVGNCRRQTQTMEGTVYPRFERPFLFELDDMSEDLVVSIFDENNDIEQENLLLGKVVIPLLKIAQAPETRWYRLKGQNLRKSADGDSPRVLISTNLEYNLAKTAAAMLGPTTTKYEKAADEQQFTMEKFKTNAKRLKDVKESVSGFSRKVSAVLSWEDPFKSTYALITYILVVLYMELWALPILPILLLLFHGFHRKAGTKSSEEEEEDTGRCEGCDEELSGEETEEEAEAEEEEEDWNIADRVKMVAKNACWMQEAMGEVADKAESLQNLFNCTVPLISSVFGLALILIMFVLYLVGFRWMILIWGVNKFRKGLVGQPSTPSKLSNLLARVPNSQRLLDQEELLATDLDVESLRELRSNASKDSLVI